MTVHLVHAQSSRPPWSITVISTETRAPLPNVLVSLPAVGISQSTDSSGQVRLTVPPGKYRLQARRIGYEPEDTQIDVAEHDPVSITILLRGNPRVLDTVAVVGTPSWKRIPEFEQRRALGLGQFISTAQLDSMADASLDAVFARRLHGVRIIGDHSVGMRITSLRAQTEDGLRNGPRGVCPPLVYMDGVLLLSDDGGPDISMISPRSIAAVEFYSASQIPAQYRSSGSLAPGPVKATPSCGAVLLWSRR